MKEIILVGGGGHCKVVVSIIKKLKEFKIIGISDLPHNVGKEILGIKIKFTDDELERIYSSGVKYAFVTLGSVGDPSKRIRLYEKLKKIGYTLPVIISPDAVVSEKVSIGEGSVIMPGVIINPSVKIGRNVIINTGAIIEHDVVIEDHVHIAPGVVLSGGVYIAEGAHIGTGASIIQNIKIGRGSIIGAGAVVVKDIPDGVVAKGVPARW